MARTKNSAASKPLHPSYDSLWHLSAIGVMDPDGTSAAWKEAGSGRPVRVATIDTSVAVDHLNLKTNINRALALDLCSTRLGAFPYLPEDGRLGDGMGDFTTDVADDLPLTSQLLSEFRERLEPGQPALLGILPATSAAFSNHGTAIAGLICATPAHATVRQGAMIEGVPTGQARDGQPTFALPYAGVNPFCEVVPISTTFDPDPEVLTLAFLYADMIGADVVLLPRDVPDPMRTYPELAFSADGAALGSAVYPNDFPERERALWDELAQLIVRISQRRPIVCAGGNAQEVGGIYPARLASPMNGIVSVGAMNAKGHVSSYSAREVTVFAPSSDGEEFDRREVRLDELATDYDDSVVPKPNQNQRFSHYEIISTDVPGPDGYTSSPFADAETTASLREFNSLYCRFGGTSAASAITAGFLSLAKTTGRLPPDADGIASKTWLLSQCRPVSDDELPFLAWDGRYLLAQSS